MDFSVFQFLPTVSFHWTSLSAAPSSLLPFLTGVSFTHIHKISWSLLQAEQFQVSQLFRESSKLERTFKIIQSSCQPSTAPVTSKQLQPITQNQTSLKHLQAQWQLFQPLNCLCLSRDSRQWGHVSSWGAQSRTQRSRHVLPLLGRREWSPPFTCWQIQF